MIADSIDHIRAGLLRLRQCGEADAARPALLALDNLATEYDRLYRGLALLLPLAEQVESRLGDLVPIPNKREKIAEARHFMQSNPAQYLSALGVENERLRSANAYLEENVAGENITLRRRVNEMANVIRQVKDAGFIPERIDPQNAPIARKASELAHGMRTVMDGV